MTGALFLLELVALGALAVAATRGVGWLLARLLPSGWPAARRADALVLLSLAPWGVGLWVGWALLSPLLAAWTGSGADHCLRHEHHEHLCPLHPGPASSALMVVGLLALGGGALRWGGRLRAVLRRRSLRRQLRALAVEVPGSPDLGLVESGRALCGVVLGASSQILVSTAVMRALSTAQWEMVLAHERAHLRRGDALVQELICFLGPVGPWGSLQAAWRAAAEEAADDEAAASGQGWLLAEALVAVAGLPPAPHPGPALLHEGVEARVRRLLQGPRVARPARWAPGAAAISLAGAASLYLWAEGAHHGLETLRHHLLGP